MKKILSIAVVLIWAASFLAVIAGGVMNVSGLILFGLYGIGVGTLVWIAYDNE